MQHNIDVWSFVILSVKSRHTRGYASLDTTEFIDGTSGNISIQRSTLSNDFLLSVMMVLKATKILSKVGVVVIYYVRQSLNKDY